MANYSNKIDYHCVPQTLSLNTEVSFVKNEKYDADSDDLTTIAIPGTGGPGNFWNILDLDTGLCEIEFDKKNNKITKINDTISKIQISAKRMEKIQVLLKFL